MTTVRQYSPCGPCIPLGTLINVTATTPILSTRTATRIKFIMTHVNSNFVFRFRDDCFQSEMLPEVTDLVARRPQRRTFADGETFLVVGSFHEFTRINSKAITRSSRTIIYGSSAASATGSGSGAGSETPAAPAKPHYGGGTGPHRGQRSLLHGGIPNVAAPKGATNAAQHGMDELIKLGWTPEAAASAVGQVLTEDPSFEGGKLGDTKRFGTEDAAAHGLFQWRDDRFRALKKFAAARGKPWEDVDTQWAFFHKESKERASTRNWSKVTSTAAGNQQGKLFEVYKGAIQVKRQRDADAQLAAYKARGAAPGSDAPVNPAAIAGSPASGDYRIPLTGGAAGRGYDTSIGKMQPGFRARLAAMMAAAPQGSSVVSGYRSEEDQARIRRTARPGYAAKGTSPHTKGIAADLDRAHLAWYQAHAAEYGLHFRMNDPHRTPYEPWHIEPDPHSKVPMPGAPANPAAVAGKPLPKYALGGTLPPPSHPHMHGVDDAAPLDIDKIRRERGDALYKAAHPEAKAAQPVAQHMPGGRGVFSPTKLQVDTSELDHAHAKIMKLHAALKTIPHGKVKVSHEAGATRGAGMDMNRRFSSSSVSGMA